MTLDEFWNIIDQARRGGSLVEMPGRLVDMLAAMEERDIIDFAGHFRNCQFLAYDAKVWLGAVVIMNGCGDDKFSDFRRWLIAQGRETFEAVLANPDALADVPAFDGEHGLPLLFRVGPVAQNAFCRRAAGDDHDSAAETRFESLFPFQKHPPLKNQKLINVGDEQARSMLPRLAARFPVVKHKSCFDEDAV